MIALLLATVAGLTACGGSAHGSRTIARAGQSPITENSLMHWITVLAPQHVPVEPSRYSACIAYQRTLTPRSTVRQLREQCQHQYVTLRSQALGYLISSAWLTGEAQRQGIAVSRREVEQRLVERRRSFLRDAEFKESIDAIGHTIADVELEITRELAAQKIEQRLSEEHPRLTSADIVGYYRHHIARFKLPERRYFDIVENIHSLAEAQKLTRELAHGRSLEGISIRESVSRTEYETVQGEKRTIYKAIFNTRQNTLSPPVLINGYYFLVKVTSTTPARTQPLAEVEGTIGKRLRAESQRRALTAFIKTWRRRWSAKTNCYPGYVIQKCRQYAGPRIPEDLDSLQ
jgi:foldase protein PrsA